MAHEFSFLALWHQKLQFTLLSNDHDQHFLKSLVNWELTCFWQLEEEDLQFPRAFTHVVLGECRSLWIALVVPALDCIYGRFFFCWFLYCRYGVVKNWSDIVGKGLRYRWRDSSIWILVSRRKRRCGLLCLSFSIMSRLGTLVCKDPTFHVMRLVCEYVGGGGDRKYDIVWIGVGMLLRESRSLIVHF